MKLKDIFQIKPGYVVSLVGAGGKSSIMWALAQEFEKCAKNVLVTTTTKIFVPDKDKADVHILFWEKGETLQKFNLGRETAKLTVLGAFEKNGKLHGLSPEKICQIKMIDPNITILVEADGSARKPFKAPAWYEPVVPECSNVVIKVIGLDILGKNFLKNNVHRCDLVKKITGLKEGEVIGPQAVAEVLFKKEGYGRKNIVPQGAEEILVLNKIDQCQDLNLLVELLDILKKKAPSVPIVVTGFYEKKIWVEKV